MSQEEEGVFRFYIPLHIDPEPTLCKIEKEYRAKINCVSVSSRTVRYCGKKVRLWSLHFSGPEWCRALNFFDGWLEVRGNL